MASRTMSSGRTFTFGYLEKKITFRIMASAGSWTTPILVGGHGPVDATLLAGIPVGVLKASVIRLSAGKFQVTLDDAYNKLTTVKCFYSGSGDAEDLIAQGGLITNLNSSTPIVFIVKTKTGAVNTDPGTTDTNTNISCELVFEDSAA